VRLNSEARSKPSSNESSCVIVLISRSEYSGREPCIEEERVDGLDLSIGHSFIKVSYT